MEGNKLAMGITAAVKLLGRGLLLTSAWLCWRPAPDEIQRRHQGRAIRTWMVGFVACAMAWTLIDALDWRRESHGYGWAPWIINAPMVAWHGMVLLTLTLLTTILVANALESPEAVHVPKRGGFVPPPPPRPADQGPIDVP